MGQSPSNFPQPLGFSYKPLASDEIRLLTLQPGHDDAPISCSISHVSLLDKPKYQPLSYAWGILGNEASITMNGKEVHVGENLRSALYHLRHRDSLLDSHSAIEKNVSSQNPQNKKYPPWEGRVIWIDALCINQEDIKEHSHQVKLMKDISSGAETAIAWLGSCGEESSTAFDHIRGKKGCLTTNSTWSIRNDLKN
jgi:hypothetical protein